MLTLIVGLAFSIALIGLLSFPLYAKPLLPYRLKNQENDLYEQDMLLNTLEELEEEYQLGRVEEKDYQQLKRYTQRQYLKAKNAYEQRQSDEN